MPNPGEVASEQEEDEEAAEDSSSEDEGRSDEEEASSSEEEDVQLRVLPNRATRGSRMGALVEDALEEEDADKEFWNQEFFQEEERDTDWESSSEESEDEPDSDFDEPEDDDDDEAEDGEPREYRQKRLAPPGAKKKAAAARATATAKSGGAHRSERPAKRASVLAAVPAEADAPTLRASTRTRVEVAQQERARQERAQQEMMARRRSKSGPPAEVKLLTQEELLAEAAKTELDNARSLATLLAREEEVRKRNVSENKQHAGPIVRYHSKRVGKDKEQTRLELVNMRQPPPQLQPQRASPAPAQLLCAVTGLPAKYRHPATGAPYATLEAFRQLNGSGGAAHASAKWRFDSGAGSSSQQDAKRQRSYTAGPAFQQPVASYPAAPQAPVGCGQPAAYDGMY